MFTAMKYSTPIVLAYFKSQGLWQPEVESMFHPKRKWRFDFSWPVEKVYLEIDGGVWMKDSGKKGRGAHNRGARIKLDWEKRNAATILGWRGLWCEPKDLCTLKLVETIRKALR